MRPEAANTPDSQHSGGSSSSSVKLQRVPAILLLAMFSIASRYTTVSSGEIPPPESGSMWAAGDSYLESAKKILDSTYANSRPSTCQALLLMGYREVGIGAMAQAWLYIGMAIRMAQDLGLHKNADKWVNVGKTLFTPDELQERRRIWYGCVVMDKYVSSYIGASTYVYTGLKRFNCAYLGRPVAIFENDFDTELPHVDQVSSNALAYCDCRSNIFYSLTSTKPGPRIPLYQFWRIPWNHILTWYRLLRLTQCLASMNLRSYVSRLHRHLVAGVDRSCSHHPQYDCSNHIPYPPERMSFQRTCATREALGQVVF